MVIQAQLRLGMIDGGFGTQEFLFPILIVGQKTPSPNPCNYWRITPVTNPSVMILPKGREI